MKEIVKRLSRKVVFAYNTRNRRRKARLIVDFLAANDLKTVILIGTKGSGTLDHETLIEKEIGRVATVLSAFDVVPATTDWPFVIADGRAMPYRTKVADLAVSNAVIEHVGGRDDQLRLVAEHDRIARAWVLTTPNRWFPVESHTFAILRHWSPKWRSSRDEFTRLLSLSEFKELLPEGVKVIGHPWSPTFIAFSPPEHSSALVR